MKAIITDRGLVWAETGKMVGIPEVEGAEIRLHPEDEDEDELEPERWDGLE